jgi:hypothetical protein
MHVMNAVFLRDLNAFYHLIVKEIFAKRHTKRDFASWSCHGWMTCAHFTLQRDDNFLFLTGYGSYAMMVES